MRLKILKLIYDELKYKIVLNNKKVINNSVYLTFIKLYKGLDNENIDLRRGSDRKYICLQA